MHREDIGASLCILMAVLIVAGLLLGAAATDNHLCKTEPGHRSAEYCEALSFWFD